jgi:hypothetical protein
MFSSPYIFIVNKQEYITINISMPRISLYKPERGLDYKFIDRQASEMFQAGGTDVYLHKYLGPKTALTGTADQPIYDTMKPTNIQDMLFLENRDRKYDTEIYCIRGMYNVQNIDFNLSQFGLFIDNDTLYMTVHINDFIKYIGRKPLSGDVVELPHLRDQFALNDFDFALPRYYVIEDVGRASEGFSVTWYPHLYRLKLKKITGGQQYDDILKGAAMDANGDPILNPDGSIKTTLEDLLSTRSKELQINDAILQQAEADAPMSGYETRQFYTLAVDPMTGKPMLETVDDTGIDASNASSQDASGGSNFNASATNSAGPMRTGYTGYLVGNGFPDNGYVFGHGIQFPASAAENDYFLRTDFMPNRLFKYDGNRWVKVEDAVRMSMTNNDSRQTLKTGFINNTNHIYNDAVAVDYVALTADQVVIETAIDYITALYVVLKFNTYEMAFDATTYPTMISNHAGKVRITLPVVDAVQQAIPYEGTWKLSLCNNREEQRQSLSKALRPKADL